MKPFPFRLGTTSYIIPADIVPNVHYLAGKVQDVQLVLFEVDDGPNNLPAPAQIAELRSLAQAHGMSYTVHLPLDLRLAEDGSPRHVSLEKARRVIDCTRALEPWAYVLHLDGRSLLGGASPQDTRHWQDQAVQALELAAALAAALAGVWVLWLAQTHLNGVTGDVFGMLVEVTETVILLVFTIGVK